jgi:capsular exopolysaccharide synthesis family protein
MSRYFNQTVNAQHTSTEQNTDTSSADQLLNIIKEVQAPAQELSRSRLKATRTVTLPHASKAPLLLTPGHADNVAVESYRALRTRIMRMQATEGIRSVVVSSAVPGDGKTVTTINLGLCYSQVRNRKVLVIDGDLRTRGLSRALGISGGPGLSEVLAGEATFEDAVVATDHANFFVMGAGRNSTPAPELFEADRWKECLNWCAETFSLVLVDSPPVRPLADFELISASCDRVMMVVRALKTQREILQKSVASIDNKKLIGIVFNASEVAVNRKHYYYQNHSADADSAEA